MNKRPSPDREVVLGAKRPRIDGGGDLLSRLDAVALGIKEGATEIKVDDIDYKNGKDFPAGDGWLRKTETGELAPGQAGQQPFNPTMQRVVEERMAKILNHRDYRFAALFANLVNLPTTSVIRTSALRTRMMQEENVRVAKKLENERLSAQADKKNKERTEYLAALKELQEEEAKIRNQVIRPAQELDDVAGLAQWRRPVGRARVYETSYWPAYMAWQYEWLMEKLGKIHSNESKTRLVAADDLERIQYIRTMDVMIYGQMNIDGTVGWLLNGITKEMTNETAMWRFTYYIIGRDIYWRTELPPLNQDGEADRTRRYHGRMLSDVLLHNLWQGLSSLPGIKTGNALVGKLPTVDQMVAEKVLFQNSSEKNFESLASFVELFVGADVIMQNLNSVIELSAEAENFFLDDDDPNEREVMKLASPVKMDNVITALGKLFDRGDGKPLVWPTADTRDEIRNYLIAGILRLDPTTPTYYAMHFFPCLRDYQTARDAVTLFLSPVVFRFADTLAPNPENTTNSATPLFRLPRTMPIDIAPGNDRKAATREQFFYHSIAPASGSASVGDLQDSITYGKAFLPPQTDFEIYGSEIDTEFYQTIRANEDMAMYRPENWPAESTALFSGSIATALDDEERAMFSANVMGRVVLPGLLGQMSERMSILLAKATKLLDGKKLSLPFDIAPNVTPVILRDLLSDMPSEKLPDVPNPRLLQESWPLATLSLIVHILLIKFSADDASRKQRINDFSVSIGRIEARLHELQREAASDHTVVSTLLQREYVHDADYIQQPLVTGRIYFDDMFTSMLALAHSDVRTKFGASDVALDQLTNLDANPDLAMAFAQYMAALHLGVRLGHTSQYHKDLEWKTRPTIMIDAIARLRRALGEFRRGGGRGGRHDATGMLQQSTNGKYIF